MWLIFALLSAVFASLTAILAKIGIYVANELRKKGLKAELTCSYAIRWFSKHPEYTDILNDPEAEGEKAAQMAGPACRIRQK